MKKVNSLIFLGIICLLSVLAVQFFMPPCAMSATAQAQAQKVYKWRMQAFMGPGNVVYDEALPKFIQNVKIMSKGQIDITLYPPGALLPSFELFTNVGKGVVDMGQDAAVYWMGFMPLGELVWGWPFTFKHAQEFDSFYWQLGAMDIVRRAAAERGVFPLVVAALNRYGSINSVVPIKGLKDLKGLKVRTFSTYGKIVQRFGGSTMTIPGEELYTALATKVIDAATWGAPVDSNAFKLYEVTKHYTMPPWNEQEPLTLIMNLKTWQTLPDDLKGILQVAAHAYAADASARSWHKDAIILEDWQKNRGVTIHWFSEEDLRTARKISIELLDEKAKQDHYSAEYITLMKKYLKMLGYMD